MKLPRDHQKWRTEYYRAPMPSEYLQHGIMTSTSAEDYSDTPSDLEEWILTKAELQRNAY